MALKVGKAEVWSAAVDDRAGGVADKLEPLSKAGANFEFVLARRAPEQPGTGIVFVAPVKGAKVARAAQAAGFARSASLQSLRVEGTNQAGAGARIARVLASAGISFRGLSAIAIGRKFVGYLAFDSAEDAAKAAGALRKLR
ncbi:MAG: amino acid-binding protein [Betaproteobacteria bacterium]|nr:amino acid-binding protein [Betaproteobacteria bacterium]